MKKNVDVVRAWRDPEYRQSLTEAERAELPVNPAESLEVSDEALLGVFGGLYLRPAVSGTSTPTGSCDCCCA